MLGLEGRWQVHQTGNTQGVLDGESDEYVGAAIRWRRTSADHVEELSPPAR